MSLIFKSIGYIRTKEANIPRHWKVSHVEGEIVIDEVYKEGLKGITPGQRIVVLFHFHKSPEFTKEYLIQKPPHKDFETGVFNTCSPIRPNPLGLSVVEVLDVEDNIIRIKGIDMIDGTPVLDIKPHHDPDK
ncbi:MAG: tRNA (N6-threonylcarbamoyladenosine(37)-N6)-methyltransferase TrmO [Nitrospirae bacterium]|nr:tRNA (N6-threonylcarbamoyladenosine(37)-N6)-methyltransferase TrmO [Nitrospirota bacterium]